MSVGGHPDYGRGGCESAGLDPDIAREETVHVADVVKSTGEGDVTDDGQKDVGGDEWCQTQLPGGGTWEAWRCP